MHLGPCQKQAITDVLQDHMYLFYDEGHYHAEIKWFLYDRDLRHERDILLKTAL